MEWPYSPPCKKLSIDTKLYFEPLAKLKMKIQINIKK